MRALHRVLIAAVTIAMLAAACGGASDDEQSGGTEPTDQSAVTEPPTPSEAPVASEPPAATEVPAQTDATDAGDADETEAPVDGNIDPALVRDDVDCSPEGLGDDESTATFSAHYVVEGNLGAVCAGEPEPVLIEAWETLAAVVPDGWLSDIAVFTGYESLEDGEEVTVAFVTAYDEDGTIFQMSLNVEEVAADADEARLTMVHEFTHVINGSPDQLDRFADPATCTTYWNGEGCFEPESVMDEWIFAFWGDGLIDEIDPEGEASVDEGQERCDANPSFFGAYAASDPEEDFAESFSAFVLQVPADTAEQQEKLDWIETWPALVEFRTNAIAAGFGPQENWFDLCGQGA